MEIRSLPEPSIAYKGVINRLWRVSLNSMFQLCYLLWTILWSLHSLQRCILSVERYGVDVMQIVKVNLESDMITRYPSIFGRLYWGSCFYLFWVDWNSSLGILYPSGKMKYFCYLLLWTEWDITHTISWGIYLYRYI
jgi:hypothetical protein